MVWVVSFVFETSLNMPGTSLNVTDGILGGAAPTIAALLGLVGNDCLEMIMCMDINEFLNVSVLGFLCISSSCWYLFAVFEWAEFTQGFKYI